MSTITDQHVGLVVGAKVRYGGGTALWEVLRIGSGSVRARSPKGMHRNLALPYVRVVEPVLGMEGMTERWGGQVEVDGEVIRWADEFYAVVTDWAPRRKDGADLPSSFSVAFRGPRGRARLHVCADGPPGCEATFSTRANVHRFVAALMRLADELDE